MDFGQYGAVHRSGVRRHSAGFAWARSLAVAAHPPARSNRENQIIRSSSGGGLAAADSSRNVLQVTLASVAVIEPPVILWELVHAVDWGSRPRRDRLRFMILREPA